MARGRRTSRGRGRGRGREEASSEVTALEFSEPARPSRMARGRAPSGGGGAGIGLVIPMAVTLVAAIALIAGGLMVAGKTKPALEGVMDDAGMAGALALSVIEPEWWEKNHGISEKPLYPQLKEIVDPVVKKIKNDSSLHSLEYTEYEKAFEEFLTRFEIKKDAGALAKERDKSVRAANAVRLERLKAIAGSNIVSARILDLNDNPIIDSGDFPTYVTGKKKTVGDVTITRVMFKSTNGQGRRYTTPVMDRFNKSVGTAEVVITAGAIDEAGSPASLALIIALVGILLVGLVAFLLCAGPSKAIRQLARDLEQVAQGNTDVRITPRGGGEVAAAARAADRALKTFRSMQDNAMAAAAAAPAAAAAGVDTADLLPNEPPRVDGYELEFVHKPAAEGGNDYFDFIQVDDTHVGVVIADMPQAGAQGAFTAATFRALMRVCGTGQVSPAVVLGNVNRVMAEELKRGDHITAMYTVLDVPNGILSVASAGHLPLIFWKLAKRGSALLNPEGIAIGLDKGPVFEKTVVDKRIKLEKGDRYVLHTDGPVAAQNMGGEEYGEERFYYLVNREAPKNSAAFVNFVANEVDLFHEGAVQLDDITIVTVRKLSD